VTEPFFAGPLVLASESPRRKQLLQTLSVPFSVVSPSIDETPQQRESPEKFVVRVAREKALEVARRRPEAMVLAADTIVTIDGEILGKPADERDAVRMLRRLSGQQHSVYTAVCLIVCNQVDQRMEGLERTDVWFSAMTEADIEDYVRRESVLDKAGAYAIQGYASVYIPKIEGNYLSVIGLPLSLVFSMLRKAGVKLGGEQEER
jgi:septum formation protein